ncbi:MAG: hypothetical protein ACOCTH_01260 [Halodesulfurarchaeum sp.]
MPSDQHETPVDHYVWKAYYIRDHWDEPSDEILAASKEKAMELVADEADVPNAGWEKNDSVDYPLYQLHRTTHHVVTVVRKPVYGDSSD